MANLTYLDFALDEWLYLSDAYSKGLRYNAMVSQAQRICECYLKHVITTRLVNNNDVMRSHNLRTIYTYIVNDLRLPLQNIHVDVMCLNNFYTHTRYPGHEAFMASNQDIDASVASLSSIIRSLQGYL